VRECFVDSHEVVEARGTHFVTTRNIELMSAVVKDGRYAAAGNEEMSHPLAKKRVLILCTANSARSQMAEGLVNALLGDRWEAASAGILPAAKVDPLAVRVMREVGIDISAARPKHISGLVGKVGTSWSRCATRRGNRARSSRTRSSGLHLSFPDPAIAGGSEEERLATFRAVRDDIGTRLVGRLALWPDTSPLSAKQSAGVTRASRGRLARGVRRDRHCTRPRTVTLRRAYSCGFHTFQTLPTRSGPGLSTGSPGIQPAGVASVPCSPAPAGRPGSAHGLGKPAAHRRRQHLHRLDHAVGVDDESPAQLDSHVLVVDAVRLADVAGLVREHVERYAALDHFRQLVVVPHLVHEVAVHADGEDLDSEGLQLAVFVGDRRHLGRSHEGEVTG